MLGLRIFAEKSAPGAATEKREDIGARIEWARQLVGGKSAADAIRLIVDLVGTGVASQESVPAAFAVLDVADGNPWQAAVISAFTPGTDTLTLSPFLRPFARAISTFTRPPLK